MQQKELSRQQFIEGRNQVMRNLKMLSHQIRSQVESSEDHYRSLRQLDDTEDRLFRAKTSVEGW